MSSSLAQKSLHSLWYGKGEERPSPGQEPLYRTRPALIRLLETCPTRRKRKDLKLDADQTISSLLRKGLLLTKTYSTGSGATLTTHPLLWPSYRPKVKRAKTIPSISKKRPRPSDDASAKPAVRKHPRRMISTRGAGRGGGLGLRKPFQPPLRSTPQTTPISGKAPSSLTAVTGRKLREDLEKRLQQARDTLRARDIILSDRKRGKSLQHLKEKWRRVAQDAAERLRSKVDPSMVTSLGSTCLSKVPLGWMLRHLGIEDVSLLGYNAEDDVFNEV
ncbi:hypothetical protein BJ684DRAFT_20523 [Piptocephalis cylindrospora]|uniref:Swi5-dependent recombination DNA repair protein 1 homolog n=1 Tax=Piptocephalis cylindrospora TaxID=1907219 RepID=A0A4P9Y266_9FUNG|nr:hypothetical protein BJ684DRAFT_20523 [Piptocephalis cylindrospora]|eukprot:RKP12958.1 hypothetical protein BJ684DRAFT_20523 [Piptocephalis cylindrospora]